MSLADPLLSFIEGEIAHTELDPHVTVSLQADFGNLSAAGFGADGICTNASQQITNPFTNVAYPLNRIPSAAFDPAAVFNGHLSGLDIDRLSRLQLPLKLGE